MAMTLTLDCWKTLVAGTGIEKLRAALVIAMVFSVCSLLVSSLIPTAWFGDASILPSGLAVMLTAILTALKLSH